MTEPLPPGRTLPRRREPPSAGAVPAEAEA